MLEYLNQNAGALTVIFTFIVAISTVVYAILTWKLVSETRALRKAQTEPKLSISLENNKVAFGFVDLVIKNIGYGPAYNISFKVEPDFEYQKGEFLSELGLIKHGIKYLAPQQEYRFFLTSLVGKFDEFKNERFSIFAKYYDALENQFEDTFLIEFSHFEGLSQLGSPPLPEIAKELKKISDNLNRIVTGSSGVRVIIFTQKDLEKERNEMEKFYKLKN